MKNSPPKEESCEIYRYIEVTCTGKDDHFDLKRENVDK